MGPVPEDGGSKWKNRVSHSDGYQGKSDSTRYLKQSPSPSSRQNLSLFTSHPPHNDNKKPAYIPNAVFTLPFDEHPTLFSPSHNKAATPNTPAAAAPAAFTYPVACGAAFVPV